MLLKIIWGLDKTSAAIFLGSLCGVFMIWMTQGKLQIQPFREDIPALMISSTRSMLVAITVLKGVENQMAQVWDMNPNSTQFPNKLQIISN